VYLDRTLKAKWTESLKSSHPNLTMSWDGINIDNMDVFFKFIEGVEYGIDGL
jgi:hypothetical protein